MERPAYLEDHADVGTVDATNVELVKELNDSSEARIALIGVTHSLE